MTKIRCWFSGCFAIVNYKRNDEYLKAFGANLRKLRAEKGFTLTSLAQDAEMEIRQLGRIESGEINTTISTVLSLAKALDVHVSDLFQFRYKK